MIESLKKNMTRKNIVAWILFGAIIIVFVFFGFTTGDMNSASYAARVNNTVISLAEFDQTRERLTQMYSQFLGDALNTPEYQQRIKFDALNQLIQREMLSQAAQKEGISISDSEIRDMIIKIPQFQEAGAFQRSYYENYLKMTNMSAGRFENQLKKDRAINRLRATLEESFEPFDGELKKIKQLRSKIYNLEYLKLEDRDFASKAKATDEEAKAFLVEKDNMLRVQLEFDKLQENFKDKKIEDVQVDIAKNLIKEDKVQKITSELAMKLEDPKAFETEVSRLGLKWQRATPVSQDAEQVIEIGASDRLMNLLSSLTKSGDYVKEVISTPQGQFAVRLRSIESQAVKDDVGEQVKAQLNSQRSNELLSNYMEALSKDYKIERNESLLR